MIKKCPELKNWNSSFNGLEEDYLQNKDKYENLYKLFSDKKSLQVLNSVIEYRKTFDINLFVKIAEPPEKHYFEDFMPRADVFVDCGAYDGDSILSYINFNPDYKMIYCFEPDCTSFEKAKSALKEYSNIQFYQAGLSDCKKTLKFNALGDMGSMISDSGDTEIDCVALDDIVKENTALIKMDIEGAELDAISGAKHLIENGSPLAISVYHKPSDIWMILELILSINPRYKFYLRHYSNCIFETVLYGVAN